MLRALIDTVQPWRARFNALSPRERMLALGCAAAVGIALLYGAIAPLVEFRATAIERQAREFQDLMWMQDNRAQAEARAADAAATSQARMSTINAAAKAVDLPLRRIQPEANGFSVQVDRQPFDKVIRWTDALESRHGIEIVSATVDLHEPGIVNARFSLR
ncbi:MAG: type II secretion system protein M [Gammaproteobacteria bacterium]|nr:type II secretion system protein M [Gammaproteobacteria bacterium]